MGNMNNWNFTGRLSKDAKVTTVNNKQLVEMDAAVNTGYGDYKKTVWAKIKWWGDRAVNAAPIFTKGAIVSGNGEISTDSYIASDGSARANLVVTVFGLNLEYKPKGDGTDLPEEPEDGEVKF